MFWYWPCPSYLTTHSHPCRLRAVEDERDALVDVLHGALEEAYAQVKRAHQQGAEWAFEQLKLARAKVELEFPG